MESQINWVLPGLRYPSRFWHFASTITVAAVGLFSKIVLVFFNNTRVYNRNILIDAIANRKSGVPLITVSNHHSCFDDPGLWGILPLKYLCVKKRIRWSLAAHDVCFTNKLHSLFFMFGKCIPVVRGDGVYQPAVDICVEKLGQGDWLHVFPEGKVNMTKEYLRLKWGVGRIIYELPKIPMIVPIWHEGMDEILPNTPPYYLRMGKKVTVNIGKPIDISELVQRLRSRRVAEPEARKYITDVIQDNLTLLRRETESLHFKVAN